MRSHIQAQQHLDEPEDLNQRIELVMDVQKKLGYVSRQALIEIYGYTQQQAGTLMRDFIHAHAKDLEWNMTHSHYSLKR
jgi:DNA-nicking Smr family endonuclease